MNGPEQADSRITELEAERDKAIAEAAELRQVLQAIWDDWTGVQDHDDNWLLAQMHRGLTSNSLEEEGGE